MTQNSFAGEGRSELLSSVSVPIRSLLLVVLTLSLAEGIGRITHDDWLRSFLGWFSVAFGIWTYVFWFRDGYRIAEKLHRALAFLVLSIVGFGLVWLLYPMATSLIKRLAMALILSGPSILELLMGRPLFRRKVPRS